MFSELYLEPRLTALFGDGPHCNYRYHGVVRECIPWNTTLLAIKQRVEVICGTKFNTALLNMYRNGHDYMGFHADDEKSLGKNPFIASVSLGEYVLLP
jgi:alkylated DNA repair dioxygenase AlkB